VFQRFSFACVFRDGSYNMSGFYDAYLKHGDQYSYTKAPRAQIFKRDAPKVTNLESFKRLLRYNDWKNDPLSLNEPGNGSCFVPHSASCLLHESPRPPTAISSRYDLRPTNPTAFGSIDGKVSSYLLAMGKDLMVEVPTVHLRFIARLNVIHFFPGSVFADPRQTARVRLRNHPRS